MTRVGSRALQGKKHAQVTQSNKIIFPNWQKKSWQTFEKATGYMRPEWVNKWPNSMTDI
jgi:hypothetical protein